MNNLAQVMVFLHALRKHWAVISSAVALVLIVGWQVAEQQSSSFQAAAVVKIKARPGQWYSGSDLWIDEDRAFIKDQIYRIRNDVALADRVVARLAAWSESGEEGEKSSQVSTTKLKELATTLEPQRLPERINVRAIAETSFYNISVSGDDPQEIVPLANAYAVEAVSLLRDEGRRAIEGQVAEWERDWEEKRALTKQRLEEMSAELADLQGGNAGFDIVRRENHAQAQLEAVRAQYFRTDEALSGSEDELGGAQAVLQSLSLRLEPREMLAGRYFVVTPEWDGVAEANPRLSPFFQALRVVESDAAVARTRERIRSTRELDRQLAIGPNALREDAGQRLLLRKQLEGLHRDLAEQSAAAVGRLASDVEALRRSRDRLAERMATLDARALETAQVFARAERLNRDMEGLRSEIRSLDERLIESARLRKETIEAGIGSSGLIEIIEPARFDTMSTITPERRRVWVLTLVAAVGVAVAIAWMFMTIDDTVRTREDFDRMLPGVPFLGVIPRITTGTPDLPRIDLVNRTGSPEVESVRALRTAIPFMRPDGEVKTVLVSSACPQEGKTTLCTNLSMMFAHGGARTLVIDADLRRARLHKSFGLDGRRGLSTVLAGRASIADVVQPFESIPGLDVMTSGPIPPNPAELLASSRFREMLAEAREKYDIVIIDAPPVVTVTDPCLIAKVVDVVCLVVAQEKTSGRLLRRASEALATVGIRAHGAIVMGAHRSRGFYGHSYYGYGHRYESYGELPREDEAEDEAPKVAGKA